MRWVMGERERERKREVWRQKGRVTEREHSRERRGVEGQGSTLRMAKQVREMQEGILSDLCATLQADLQDSKNEGKCLQSYNLVI